MTAPGQVKRRYTFRFCRTGQFKGYAQPRRSSSTRNWKKMRSTQRDNSCVTDRGKSAGATRENPENEKDCRSMSARNGKSRSGISSEVGTLFTFDGASP